MIKPIALSIIIPVFNREQTIRRAIQSVLQSPRNDIEVIISDDGSTDQTMHEVLSINDQRIRTLRNSNRHNANYARLQGVRNARSDLIAFLDSDDEFLESRVEELINEFNNNSRLQILIGSFIVNKNGKLQTPSYPSNTISNEQLQTLLVAHGIPITFSSVAARKGVILENNLLDSNFYRHQDRDFLLTSIHQCLKIVTEDRQNIIKHQVADSFSRSYIGYIPGLDTITCKHPIFSSPQYTHILSYLIARTFIQSIIRADIRSLIYNKTKLAQSICLPKNIFLHIFRYKRGKNLRKKITEQIRNK